MASRKKTKYIVVHATATPPNMDIGAAEVDEMHKSRGWNGIGYGELIRRNGKLEEGRGIDAIGAHVAGFNSISMGIVLVGGVDNTGRPQNNFTAAQMVTLSKRLRELAAVYPEATICGHRDLSPDKDGDGIIEPFEHLKACPCFDVIPWANKRALPGARIKGVWSAFAPGAAAPLAPDRRIVYLQVLLKHAGYEFGPADGIVGPKTEAALKRFQCANGFAQTGEFDPTTVERLRKTFEKPIHEAAKQAVIKANPTIKPPAKKATTKDLLAQGSRTISNANFGEVVTGVGAVGGGVVGAASNVVGTATATKSIWQQLEVIWPFALLVVIGAIAWMLFQRAKKIRVDEHNTGVNISRRTDAVDENTAEFQAYMASAKVVQQAGGL